MSNMKATLKFSLPDDEGDFQRAIHANKAWSAIYEIREAIRKHRKYGQGAEETIQQIEEELSDVPEM